MKKNLAVLLFVFACALWSCQGDDAGTNDNFDNSIPAPVLMTYQVVNQFPHDTSAFTEGFSFYNGQLYESTGSPDEVSHSGTWIANIDLKTGKYNRRIDLGRTWFGEGITFLNDLLYQLTYKTQKGFIYDAKTFKKVREFSYKSEGWGLTNDGKHLIMSAGTSNIYYLTPDSIKFTRILAIQDNNGYVGDINELEFIDGYLYANKWLTTEILKIDTATGYVVGRFDLAKQVAEVKSRYPGAMEMNGIAYDSTTRKTYITGKKWPVIYEIKW